ncbi:MAG: hypothetical protein L3J68_04415 [Thermoplasmata archaeon]|nr:hypothetical protein [Thermoplasmata archaeon]
MGARHVGDVLSLLRQGLTLGYQYGAHSVEALLWVAETVEEGVYESGSLRRTPDGIAFALENPPLRVGAFTSVALRVDGTPVPGDSVRFRSGPGAPWRTATAVAADAPLNLAPGDRTEFDLAGEFGHGGDSITVRLELRTPALPPLVWFEFSESPTEAALEP